MAVVLCASSWYVSPMVGNSKSYLLLVKERLLRKNEIPILLLYHRFNESIKSMFCIVTTVKNSLRFV